MRTKSQIRSSKSKGAQLEYSVYDSLKEKYPGIYLTKHLGFVQQFDLCDATAKITIECKRHKSFSWNELVDYFKKLEKFSPQSYIPHLVFQANRQPVLVMVNQSIIFPTSTYKTCLTVQTFEDYFGTPFIKHKGIKKGGNSDETDNKVKDMASKKDKEAN